MRAHYLQHVPFEGLGSIEAWLGANGYQTSVTRLFAGEDLPRLDDVDFLIIMGGPMSVNDEKDFSWLATEKAFVREAIGAGKPVLGICLGAQLIASALGATVYANACKEIGWFPVTPVGSDSDTFSWLANSVDVFHWHGETFDLPPGAIHLARSEGCEHQAFRIGDSIVGLQFHLETTPESANAIVTNCREELSPSKYVQTEAEILSATGRKYQAINALMDQILSSLHRTLVESP